MFKTLKRLTFSSFTVIVIANTYVIIFITVTVTVCLGERFEHIAMLKCYSEYASSCSEHSFPAIDKTH